MICSCMMIRLSDVGQYLQEQYVEFPNQSTKSTLVSAKTLFIYCSGEFLGDTLKVLEEGMAYQAVNE